MNDWEHLLRHLAAPPYIVVLGLLVAGIGGVGLAYLVARKVSLRIRLLQAMFGLTAAFWLALSFFILFCLSSVGHTVDYVFWGANLVCAGSSLTAFALSGLFLLRGGEWVSRVTLARLDLDPPEAPPGRLTVALHRLAKGMGLAPPVLRLARDRRPYSLALEGRNPTLVVSRGLMSLLAPDELEAVLAHELAHLRAGDGSLKLLTGSFSRALFFDPLTKLLHSALCRQKEFAADEAAARVQSTTLPLSLALLKIARAGLEPPPSIAAVAIIGPEGGWRSPHPTLEARLIRLQKLETLLNADTK